MTKTKQRPEHLNGRPDWNCRLCARPWPCPAARAELLAEYRAFPTVLSIYLTAQMYEALSDSLLGSQPTPEDLYSRFVAWARPPALSGT